MTENGKEVSRDVFNNSSYRSTDNVYAVGTASSKPEASAIVSASIGSQDLGTIQSAIGHAQNLGAQQAAEEAAAEAQAAEEAAEEQNEKAGKKSKKEKKAEAEEDMSDDEDE